MVATETEDRKKLADFVDQYAQTISRKDVERLMEFMGHLLMKNRRDSGKRRIIFQADQAVVRVGPGFPRGRRPGNSLLDPGAGGFRFALLPGSLRSGSR